MDKQQVTIQLAQKSDIQDLLHFQEKFHHYEKIENGDIFFITIHNDPFSKTDFEKIISHQECSFAKLDGEIIGWILIDNGSETQCLKDHQKSINYLKQTDYLPSDINLATRYAEFFNPAYKNEELCRELLLNVLHHCKHKYEYLFCVVFANAELLIEKLNMGWEIAYDNGVYYFLVWDILEINSQKI